MPLNSQQIKILGDAIKNYNFPPVVFDFNKDKEGKPGNMVNVDSTIQHQLLNPLKTQRE